MGRVLSALRRTVRVLRSALTRDGHSWEASMVHFSLENGAIGVFECSRCGARSHVVLWVRFGWGEWKRFVDPCDESLARSIVDE